VLALKWCFSLQETYTPWERERCCLIYKRSELIIKVFQGFFKHKKKKKRSAKVFDFKETPPLTAEDNINVSPNALTQKGK
jgi:hypothetical protein